VLMMGKSVDAVPECPSGNTIAIVGIDNHINKSATITTREAAHCFTSMKFSVSPVVRVAVEPKHPSDLPKFVEALKRLSKSDPCVQCSVEPTGEHIIACAGELHWDVILRELKTNFCPDMELVVSDPVVALRESILKESSIACLSKSTNKLNRLFVKVEPLDKALQEEIDSKKLFQIHDLKERARHLATNYAWNVDEARKIWCFAPNTTGPNCLVDMTKGQQYMGEIKNSVIGAFQTASSAGPICEEELRGVRLNVLDAVIHADPVHRGGNQIIPAARRATLGAILMAEPCLLEPIYLIEIQTVERAVSAIFNVLNKRRGMVIEIKPSASQTVVRAYLPVLESFGLTAALREATSGQAYPQCVFDHWDVVQGNPLEEGTRANLIAKAIRKRKGLRPEFPTPDYYLDRL